MQTSAFLKTAAACLLLSLPAFSAGCASGPVLINPTPQYSFWQSLSSLCGKAYQGTVVEDSTNNPDFADKPLVMHVRTCTPDTIRVHFNVGDDRSRTWVFSRVGKALRLKHDHRHEDGTEDELTQYGGDTRDSGTWQKQDFHADAHTAILLPAAATNIWTVEIEYGQLFAYALRREGTDRRFRAEFDLSKPIPAPPPSWGH